MPEDDAPRLRKDAEQCRLQAELTMSPLNEIGPLDKESLGSRWPADGSSLPRTPRRERRPTVNPDYFQIETPRGTGRI
jgi:hypothetical protein